MSLTKTDLRAIKDLIDHSIDERVLNIIDERIPKIIDERVPAIIEARVPAIIDRQVQPMLDKLEACLTGKIDQLALDMGQFSLETTNNFIDLEKRLGDRIDTLSDKLALAAEMADTNRVEITKVKRKLGLA